MNSTGKIFLGGGGNLQDSQILDALFFETLPPTAHLLYIPIAMQKSKIGFEACFDWFASLLSTYNQGNEYDFTMLLETDPLPSLSKYDAVYLGGGNTYKLLSYLHQSGLSGAIQHYLKTGGVVYGGSAGAIVLGKDIRTVEEENTIGYTRHDGLDLLNGASLLCHYTEAMTPNATRIRQQLPGPLYCIPEDGGVVVNYATREMRCINGAVIL